MAYLAWLGPIPLAESRKSLLKVFLRAFLDENRRYGWLASIPPGAVMYRDELSVRRRSLPRFVPEFIMGQLESDANLACLRVDDRHLVVLIAETGLRAGDACSLAFDPLITDSSGWPCLRFKSWKMNAEQLVPLSSKAADAVRAQQAHVERALPEGSPWLFPARRDASLPQSYDTFRAAFTAWQARIRLHVEAGRAVRITPHQLRHYFVISPRLNPLRDVEAA